MTTINHEAALDVIEQSRATLTQWASDPAHPHQAIASRLLECHERRMAEIDRLEQP